MNGFIVLVLFLASVHVTVVTTAAKGSRLYRAVVCKQVCVCSTFF